MLANSAELHVLNLLIKNPEQPELAISADQKISDNSLLRYHYSFDNLKSEDLITVGKAITDRTIRSFSEMDDFQKLTANIMIFQLSFVSHHKEVSQLTPAICHKLYKKFLIIRELYYKSLPENRELLPKLPKELEKLLRE